jgi:hypothetical protein
MLESTSLKASNVPSERHRRRSRKNDGTCAATSQPVVYLVGAIAFFGAGPQAAAMLHPWPLARRAHAANTAGRGFHRHSAGVAFGISSETSRTQPSETLKPMTRTGLLYWPSNKSSTTASRSVSFEVRLAPGTPHSTEVVEDHIDVPVDAGADRWWGTHPPTPAAESESKDCGWIFVPID